MPRLAPLRSLAEFCTAVVEEFEAELADVVKDARPISDELTQSFPGWSVKDGVGPRYELKEAVCVETTGSCTRESLSRISRARIKMGAKQNPEVLAAMNEYYKKMGEKMNTSGKC